MNGMNVVLISPGFPDEMPLFTRGLAAVGARVLGVGDQPQGALPPLARESLSSYLQVRGFQDEEEVLREVRHWMRGRTIDRIECLWEPGVILAARLREAFGVPGMRVEQSIPFRDKERMKQVLDAAGVRTPRHARARTKAECREAAERIGYPLVIKPIAGAGSADTYPLREPADLESSFALLEHVPEVSVEEYIDGEEHTFDTICSNGDVLFHNVAWYRPKPLVARLNPWISIQTVCLRQTDAPELDVGRELGRAVLRALGFETGFTHMEWFRTPAGEAVFGEIGARPPGARLVHGMNYSCDADFFAGWAEAVCYGRLSQRTEKRYNAAIVFKRAEGEGRIQRIEGLDRLFARYGDHVVHVELVPVGAPRRDWRQSAVGDGWVVVRHPSLEYTLEMADRVGTDLRLYAG
jgi:hypothetical protein